MAAVLTTNGGPHSPETWAMATAEQLVTVDSVAPGPWAGRLFEAMKLRMAVAEALIGHHAKVQEEERGRLAADADAHFASDYAPHSYLDAVVADVVDAAKSTEWAAHFLRSEVQDAVRQIAGQHFVDSMHIERLWHALRNPDNAAGRAYVAKHEGN